MALKMQLRNGKVLSSLISPKLKKKSSLNYHSQTLKSPSSPSSPRIVKPLSIKKGFKAAVTVEVNTTIKSRSLIPSTTTPLAPTTPSAKRRKHTDEKDVLFRLAFGRKSGIDQLLIFEKELLSSVVHTFRLGVYLQQKVDGTASELDETANGLASLQKL